MYPFCARGDKARVRRPANEARLAVRRHAASQRLELRRPAAPRGSQGALLAHLAEEVEEAGAEAVKHHAHVVSVGEPLAERDSVLGARRVVGLQGLENLELDQSSVLVLLQAPNDLDRAVIPLHAVPALEHASKRALPHDAEHLEQGRGCVPLEHLRHRGMGAARVCPGAPCPPCSVATGCPPVAR